jgi:hypothetical protein
MYAPRESEVNRTVPFWNRGANSTPEASPEPDPDPIAVFETAGVVEGLLPWQERRLSDTLNAGQPLRVHVTRPGTASADWEELDPDRVIAVAAPPRPAPSAARMARRRHEVTLHAGPYRFSGIAHMPAGADPGRFVRSTPQRWLPLTRCTVTSPDGEFEVEVLIVNLEHVSRH